MSALPDTPDPRTPLHLVVPPAEMVESEDLVIRQANALVIASDDDYKQAGDFLNQVIVAGRKQVEEFFNPHVGRAFDAHRALTADRAKHLKPWTDAERIVKDARVTYWQAQQARIETERRERERVALAQAEEQKRQEAEAELRRAEDEAQRRRDDAETQRVADEAEAERLRNAAAEEANDTARQQIEQQAAEIEAKAERETQSAEADAARIEQSGQAAAAAIAAEPIHLDLPSAPTSKLGGVAKAWGVDKEEFDRVAFALWIAGNPAEGSPAYVAATARAKYIGEPAWALLTSEAKQQEKLFDVGGITAGPKYSGRTGKS